MCEAPDIFESRIVVGRKLYHCCECLKLIERGERHQHTKGLWDGEWSAFRTCLDCSEILADIYRNWDSNDCGMPLGYLFEYAEDYIPDASVWLEQRKANIEKKKQLKHGAV
jgi:hypothetical protein